MIKRLLPILLLTIVIYNMAGVFVVFKYELAKVRKEVKHQIKNGIPEDELHFFSLTQHEYEQLDWTREGKEFRYNGEMFDIVHRKNVNGKVRTTNNGLLISNLFNIDSSSSGPKKEKVFNFEDLSRMVAPARALSNSLQLI